MERRHFLKLGLLVTAGGMLAAKAVSVADAAPVPPVDPAQRLQSADAPQPAVVDQSEADRLQPEPVRWHRWRWRRRVWRHRWHRRFGWRRRVWRRRYW